jgi:hypothetical protein
VSVETSLRLILLLLLSACTSWGAPRSKLADDSRVGVEVRLDPGYLHLQVLVAARCRAADEGPCPPGRAVSQLAVAVRTPMGDQELGKTWSDGGLDVPFSQLNSLFPNQSVAKQRQAPLLVEGRVVAELPVDEIFRKILESAIAECDAALADPSLQPDYAQALLGRMLDLRLLGLTDARLTERTIQLADSVRGRPAAMWSTPKKPVGRSEQLLAGLRASGDEHAVPEEVQRQITRAGPVDVTSSSFRWALEWLPTVCKVTVKGGVIVGSVALTGAPGIALAILDATVGGVYSDWMIKTCCQRVSDVFGAEKPPECG